MKAWHMITIGALTTALLASLNGLRKNKGYEDIQPLAEGTDLEPMAYGKGSDPQIQALLAEYEAWLADQGVNTDWFSAKELTKLHRTGKYAIPPKHLWDEMARTIVAAAQPIREAFGHPIRIYNGFRPKWYNDQVGGAPKSLHIRNAALDMLPVDPKLRRKLAETVAAFAKVHGKELRMGVGIYHYPYMTGAHVDALVRKRFVPYASTKEWMKHV